ncbi:hypothetical protein F4808DRAFT_420768 [Astrocystis sublimbata]|nr:hypothetical protein F4808DRAFT_420768 [Astrocystis sublimbata]
MDRRGVPPHDQSTVFQILLWFLFIVAFFSLAARLGTKYAMTRRLNWDDSIMLAAQSVYLAQCVSMSLGASQGLGEPMGSLPANAVEGFLRAEYVSVVFQLITLALIKWSISASIQQLSPSVAHRRLDKILRVVVGLWLLTAVLTSVFQCALPTPWDYLNNPHCINRRAWWTYVAVGNIGTEFSIIALYFLIIGNLRMSLAKKFLVIMVFSTRLLVIGIALTQLAVFLYAFPVYDLTLDLWLPSILDQATLSASIVTASIPYLRPFMESLESGIARVENLSGSEENLSHARASPSTYYMSDISSSACSPPATTHS